jgi:hypothetical protein
MTGVHEAGGIWLYSFGYRNTHPKAWSEYVKALHLIKQTIRSYIIDGVKSHPKNAFLTPIDPTAYILQLNLGDYLALPNDAQQYTAINLTLFRKGNIGYLIATNSVMPQPNQQFTLQVTLDNPIMMVEVVSGVAASIRPRSLPFDPKITLRLSGLGVSPLILRSRYPWRRTLSGLGVSPLILRSR